MANESMVDVALVERWVRYMIEMRVVALLPLLQYTDVYVCTPDIQILYEDKNMQKVSAAWIT